MKKVIYLGIIILLASITLFMIGGALFLPTITMIGGYGLLGGIIITFGAMAIDLNLSFKVKGE